MRIQELKTAVRIVEGSLVACALLGLAACSEPQAVTDLSDGELLGAPTTASVQAKPSSTVLIREVRLGHGLDVDRKVPPSFTSRRFLAGDPIKMSMWVAATPAGSVIRASVRDAGDRMVWSDEQPAPANGSYVAFDVGRQLSRGKYQVEINVDQAVASRASMEVVDRENWARR